MSAIAQELSSADDPDWMDPMLAVLTDRRFSDENWIFERKLDGERVLVFREGNMLRLMSRNQACLNGTYPELVDALLRQPVRDYVADGEVVAFNGDLTDFSRLQGRMQIRDPDAARQSGIKVYLYLFDLMRLNRCDLTDKPLRRRKADLKQAMNFEDPLRFTPHRNADGEAFYADACSRGWEGLIAKRADAPYHHGRSRDWLKFKCENGQELVIGGFTRPEGDRSGFGALLVGYFEGRDLCYAGKVGTGFDDDFLNWFRDRLDGITRKTSPFANPVDTDAHWVRPEYVAQIGFTEWTEGGKLRHPRFLGLRRDKPAEDVVRERAEDA